MALLDAEDLVICAILVLAASYWIHLRYRVVQAAAAQILGHQLSTLELAGPVVFIVFASQSGTASDLAARLARELDAAGCPVTAVVDPSECAMEDFERLPPHSLVVFLLATFGDGEAPENAAALADYLRNPEPTLAHMHYAIFGLGSSAFHKFNAFAKETDARCRARGAKQLVAPGVSDDAYSVDDQFSAWLASSWPALAKHLGISASRDGLEKEPQQQFTLHQHSANDPELLAMKNGVLGAHHGVTPIYARVLSTQNIFAKDAARRCIHVELSIAGSGQTYAPGDHLAVWPQNPRLQVERLAEAAGINDAVLNEMVFSLNPTDSSRRSPAPPFPCPTTCRAAFTHYLDISRPLKMHAFKTWLAHIDKVLNPDAWMFYNSLATSKESYALHVVAAHATAAEILTTMPIPELPLLVLLQSFQRIQPRYYSISSSPSAAGPAVVHITAVVVSYCAPNGSKEITGLCSGYLESLGPSARVPVSVRRSNFKLPRKPLSTAVIMIGPGTGVAPFRGFVQERGVRLTKARAIGRSEVPSPAILFYGCRNREQEYLFGQEWIGHLQTGALSELHVAFSRDSSPQEYVQHRLLEHRQDLWKHVAGGAHVYICGDGRHMARDVEKFFIETAAQCGDMDHETALNWLSDLRMRGRYSEDVWTSCT